ncbi:TetR/AcrR family transcriptional regulator [Candidatus Gracilibacteria bacterium]|nr:TetR/AcrR family transcriptional regulator [Candidatus Gracilibacteria bacterium]
MNKRKVQKEATAARIFAAAMELFQTQGYRATTVEQITQRAGVAKGTFFTHFPSKEAVLNHVGDEQMQRVNTTIAAAGGFAAWPVREQLKLIYRSLGEGVTQNAPFVRTLAIEALVQQSLLDYDAANISALDALLATIISAAQARGEIRSGSSAAEVATLLRGVYFVAIITWFQQGDVPFTPIALRYLDLVLDGIDTKSG